MKCVLLASALVIAAAVPLAADQKSHGSHGNGAKHEGQAEDGARVNADIHFSVGEQRVIHADHAPRYQSLPPGLQKKVARGKPLPPGWQNKLQPFPAEVERQLTPLPAGYGRCVFDGHAVIYSTKNHAVVDVAVLF